MGGLLGWATSDQEIGARLVLAGRAEFSADAKKASADVEELGTATADAGAKAKAGSAGFNTAGDAALGAGKKAKTGSSMFVTAGNKMLVAGKKMQAAGRRLTHTITLPVLAIGAASVKSATDFNTMMTRIHTQAGGSAKDVKILSAQVLTLAKTAQQGPNQLAASLYHLKAVGMDNVTAMKALRQSSKLAAVSGADLEDTTNALAGAWRTGIPGAKNFRMAVASINAISGAGNIKTPELISALGTGILPSAKTFGLTLKDVGAALALFTDEGVPANAAATRLRMSFSLLGAPTGKALKQLKSIGISQYELGNDMRKKNGLVTAIGDLKSHLDASGLSATKQAALLSRAFGGGRSSTAILSMLNNYEALRQKQSQVTKGIGKFGEAVKAQAKTPQAQFKLLIAKLEQLGVVIGTKLLPYAIRFVAWLSNAVTWFDKLSPRTKKWIGYAVLALAALGPLLSIGGRLVKVIGLLSKAIGFLVANPWVAAILLITIALVLAYKKFKWFRDFVHAVWKDLQVAAAYAWQYMQKAWKSYGQPMLQLAIAIFKVWWAITEPILKGIAKLWQWTWSIVKPILKLLINIIKHVLDFYMMLMSVAGKVARAIANGLDYARTHWSDFLSFMKKVPGKIGGFFKGLGSTLLSPFKWAFNEIAKAWNNTVGKLSFKVPHWVPFIGGKGWSVPDIPLWGGSGGGGGPVNYAGVGTVQARAVGGGVQAGRSYIVGERGPELFRPTISGAIVPTSRVNSVLDKGAVSARRAVAATLGNRKYDGRIDTSGMRAGANGETIVIQIPLDGKVVAETVYKHTRDKAARK